MDYKSECVIFEVKSKLKWWCCILLYIVLYCANCVLLWLSKLRHFEMCGKIF